MTNPLVKRLRTCPSEERKKVALTLARQGTEEAVDELLRMAEGGRRHWLQRYDRTDQIIAVMALGESGSERALEYLKKVDSPWKSRPRPISQQRVGREQGGQYFTTHERVEVDYPEAPDGLREQLQYTVDVYYVVERHGDMGMPARRQTGQRDSRRTAIHRALQEAIEKLQERLSVAS